MLRPAERLGIDPERDVVVVQGDALSPLGVEVDELPLDPSRIWQLIEKSRS